MLSCAVHLIHNCLYVDCCKKSSQFTVQLYNRKICFISHCSRAVCTDRKVNIYDIVTSIPASHISRLQQIQNTLVVLSLKLLSPVISLPSYALSTGSWSLNASNTSSSHLPTKFSQLPNLRTFITSSPLNVLAILALHPSLLLLGHRHHSL